MKREYSAEFEIKDDAIDFGIPQNNQPFSIELAANYMYIANFIIGTDGMDISYFISSPDSDRYELIHMSFEKDMKFKYIFVGDA
ncbi:hypothetical protein [Psychrobacillus sp. NPDC093200]|uniref:hypothetical protein n=1 Tax=Psychrobacillus sp. NPDC093200 TaxID=3390656 RepID=UPI003D09408E